MAMAAVANKTRADGYAPAVRSGIGQFARTPELIVSPVLCGGAGFDCGLTTRTVESGLATQFMRALVRFTLVRRRKSLPLPFPVSTLHRRRAGLHFQLNFSTALIRCEGSSQMRER